MHSFTRNLLSVYAVNLINGFLGIIVIPISVNLLGLDGYGLFSIYGVLASYVALVDLGVTKNFTRCLASEQNKTRKQFYLQIALGFYIILSLFLLFLLPVFVLIVPKFLFPVSSANVFSLRMIVIFTVLEYIIAIPTNMIQTYCIAKEGFASFSKFLFISGLYRYVIIFLAVLIFRSPVILVGLIVARRIIDYYVARYIMGDIPAESWRPRFDFNEIKLTLFQSASLSLAQICQTTIVAIGSFLSNRFFGLEGLGIYRSVFDLASKIWFFSNGLGLVVFPRFARLLSTSNSRERLFLKITFIFNASWFGFNVISLIGIFLAPGLLSLLRLDQQQSCTLFILLLLGVSINAHSNLSYEFLQAAGKYKLVAGLSAVSLVMLLASFFVFHQNLGLFAIGIAWIVSQTFYSIIADSIVIKISNHPTKILTELVVFKVIILSGTVITMISHFQQVLVVFRYIPLYIFLAGLGWIIYRYKLLCKLLLYIHNLLFKH